MIPLNPARSVRRQTGERLYPCLNHIDRHAERGNMGLIKTGRSDNGWLTRADGGEQIGRLRADAPPDEGTVSGDSAGSGARYLPQGTTPADARTAADCLPWFGSLWRLGRHFGVDATAPAEEALRTIDAFEQAGGWPAFARLERVLAG